MSLVLGWVSGRDLGYRCPNQRGSNGQRFQTLECLKSALLLKVALYCNRLLMSLTQSSSLPGPTPSDFRSCMSSLIDDRLIQGIGYCDAWTRTDSPGFKIREDWPSIETPEEDRLLSPTYGSSIRQKKEKLPSLRNHVHATLLRRMKEILEV